MQSSMAAPSLRNSGLLATSTGCGQCLREVVVRPPRLVPTGTVLLMTTIFGPLMCCGQGGDDGAQGAQVGRAVGRLGRADGDEDDLAPTRCRRARLVVKVSRPSATLLRDHLAQARLVDRQAARFQHGDLPLVLVDAGHVVAALGEAGARDQADVARADERDLHLSYSCIAFVGPRRRQAASVSASVSSSVYRGTQPSRRSLPTVDPHAGRVRRPGPGPRRVRTSTRSPDSSTIRSTTRRIETLLPEAMLYASPGIAAFHEQPVGGDHVADVAQVAFHVEVARLQDRRLGRPAAMRGESAGEAGDGEAGRLPRPGVVERPGEDDLDAVLPAERLDGPLGGGLAAGVGRLGAQRAGLVEGLASSVGPPVD